MGSEVKSNWFESWFNTRYYHLLYKHRDHQEAEDFILRLLKKLNLPEGADCLDLACGKGRHALFLQKQNLNVTGLDLSENSIKAASKFSNDQLVFDVHDMREVYAENAYDAVFNLFTSFGYFDSDKDNLKVLNAVYQMLRKDGVFVIDFLNAEKTIAHLVKEEVKSLEGIDFHIKRWADEHHIYKNIEFSDEGKSYSFTERVQALFKKDFERMLDETGFKVMKCYGSLKLDAFEDHTSDRLILIVDKK